MSFHYGFVSGTPPLTGGGGVTPPIATPTGTGAPGTTPPTTPAPSGGIDWNRVLGTLAAGAATAIPVGAAGGFDTPSVDDSFVPEFDGFMSPGMAGMSDADISALLTEGFHGFSPEQIFGKIPRHEPYINVDLTKSERDTALGNLSNLDVIEKLLRRSNNVMDRDAIDRAEFMGTGYTENIGKARNVASMLLGGQLPYDDVLDIVSNRAELQNKLGIPGSGTRATLKDLGLSRMDAFDKGLSTFERINAIAESVNPSAARIRPADRMLTPQNRLSADLEQAARDQASRQSGAFLEAMADPVAANLFSANFLGNATQPAANPYL